MDRRTILVALAVVLALLALTVVLWPRQSSPRRHARQHSPAIAAPKSTGPAASQQTTATDGVVVYSDQCAHADDGQIDGLQITVLKGAAGPRILGQYAANGVLPPPSIARVRAETGGLAFELSSSGARFLGRVEGDHVTVRAARAGAEPYRLERQAPGAEPPLCG